MKGMRCWWWIFALVLLSCAGGCGGGGKSSDAPFTFAWPTDGGFASMQSLRIEVLNSSRSFGSVVVTRPAEGGLTTIIVPDVSRGTVQVVATAYDGENGAGAILGQARGAVQITGEQTPPQALSTILDPAATLTISPALPTIDLHQTKQFTASMVNPDGAFAFLTANSLRWTSGHPDIVSIDDRSGLATAVAVGETAVTVTDQVSDKQGATTVRVVYPRPTVDISANRTRVNYQDTVRLSWTSRNADRVVAAENFNTTVLNGNQSVTPTETTTYKITVRGPGGEASDSVTVTVDYPKPTVTLTVDNAAVYPGQAVRLAWTTKHATSVMGYNFNATALNGSTTIYPSSTTTYSIIAYGPGGNSTASITVYCAGMTK